MHGAKRGFETGKVPARDLSTKTKLGRGRTGGTKPPRAWRKEEGKKEDQNLMAPRKDHGKGELGKRVREPVGSYVGITS